VRTADVAQLLAADWSSYQLTGDAMTEFVRELTDFDMSGWRDGTWRKLPMWQMPRFDFGAPFGVRACAPMALEEIRRLPAQCPTLRNATLYMAGFNPVADWLAMPVALAMMRLSPRLGAPAARLLVWSLRRFGRPPYGSVVQVVATGEGHDPVTLRVSYPEGGYWLTAAVAAATTLQYLDGTWRTPGVHVEGLVTDPVRLLATLADWGARVEGE
jgi:hypothetical protein